MRSICLMLLLVCLGACASTSRIVATKNDQLVSVSAVASALRDADVVALGELHKTPGVHRTHHQLIEALYQLRPNMVIAMEMFERDVQPQLDMYLTGVLSEAEFKERSRPWPEYERDYRPVIEFAKQNGIPVLAANAPRPLAQKAAKEGLDAVMPHKHLARETTAPLDNAYWDAFNEMMEGHAGMFGPGGMERYYASQCLKDDTMAESITDYMQQNRDPRQKLLAVLICGSMHSNYGRGTVQRIKNRMPDLDIRVLSAETVEDMGSGTYESPRDVGEYVIVCAEPVRKPVKVAVKPKMPKADEHQAGGDGEGSDEGAEEITENPEGLRPALGFMPDYSGEVAGVGVGAVTEGGAAEAAGIEDGDVIVALNGIPTPDIEMYMDVLDSLLIGRNATVRVQRGEAEVDLQVKVGSRPAH